MGVKPRPSEEDGVMRWPHDATLDDILCRDCGRYIDPRTDVPTPPVCGPCQIKWGRIEAARMARLTRGDMSIQHMGSRRGPTDTGFEDVWKSI
jgi:hypothetical protein